MEIKEYVEQLFDFAVFVAKEIFDDEWETNNKEAFAEIACRKLVKLGLVEERKNEYIFKDKDQTIG